MKRLYNLLISIDQLFAVLLFGANPDQTISGYVGYKSMTTDKKRYKLYEWLINALFRPWEKNHCRNAIEYDRLNEDHRSE
jgi:hypothetical protein